MIDLCVEKVDDFAALMKGKVGSAAPGAVNTIMAKFGVGSGQSMLVSQYATRKVAKFATDDLIAFCRAALARNPSWQGWVTEMEVLHLFSTQKRTPLWYERKQVYHWNGGPDLIEEDVVDHTAVYSYDTYSPGTWLFPDKWNEALFDGLQIVGDVERTVRVVQVTDATNHSFKLSHLNSYLDSLGSYKVDFVFVCRRKNVDSFALPVVRGVGTCSTPVSTQYALEPSEPERTMWRGRDFVGTAHEQLRIEVRKLCYEQFQATELAERKSPYTFFELDPKIPRLYE